MANIKSALKRIRQTAKRDVLNQDRRSRYRTFSKRVITAVASNDLEAAKGAFRDAVSVLAVAAKKGVIHRNQASRRIKRLNAKVKGMVMAAMPTA